MYWMTMISPNRNRYLTIADEKMNFDIAQASLREFEDFVFEHDVHRVGSDNVWYHQFDLEIQYDPEHNARQMTEMFNNAHSLHSKYSEEKLEQGCWALFGAGFDGNLSDLIWDQTVPIEHVEALIHSTYFMFRDLFATSPLGQTCEMWWDGLAYDIHPMGIADPINNPTHRRIQNAMFETLSKILELEAEQCQMAALHGLNHVRHPHTVGLISAFIRKNPDLSNDDIEYALSCARGEAL